MLPESAEVAVDDFVKKQREIRDWSPAPPTSPTSSTRRKVVLTREEDRRFHAQTMAQVREWLDAPISHRRQSNATYPPEEGASILLPECNSFLRRSLYEAISHEYPYLITETEHGRIRAWRLTPDELKLRSKRLLIEGFKDLIQEKVGAYRIFLALSKAARGDGKLSKTERNSGVCFFQALSLS